MDFVAACFALLAAAIAASLLAFELELVVGADTTAGTIDTGAGVFAASTLEIDGRERGVIAIKNIVNNTNILYADL
jgi:hypothetical protein